MSKSCDYCGNTRLKLYNISEPQLNGESSCIVKICTECIEEHC